MADRGDVARAYRKKPVVVEAVQWTGENHAEMCEFIDPEAFEIIPRIGLVIHTLEGDHHASLGDYIIKGVNGEFYPCKPDIFAKTYESSTFTPQNEWVSVEDRLPDELTMVLIYSGGIYDVAGWIEDEDGEICWTHNVKPQFWMPLPAPPDRRPPEGEA